MKTIFTRESSIRKNAVEIKDPASTAVAYISSPTNPAERYTAMAFSGKRQKPYWHYSFRNETEASARIALHAQNVRQTEALRVTRAAQIKANRCLTPIEIWEKVRGGQTSISAAETAICLRAALSRALPGVKFSVRSDVYSGGSSVNVRWTDGPTAKQVDAVASRYSFKGFDGMVDCAYYKDRWLSRDGEMTLAHSPGHAGGGGTESVGDPHGAGCVLVTGGAGYISTSRDRTDAALMADCRRVAERYGVEMPAEFPDSTALHRWINTTRIQWGNGMSDYFSHVMHQVETGIL